MADPETFGAACHALVEGQYEAAAQGFVQLLTAQGDHPGVRHNYALSLECAQKFEEAKREYEAVVGAFPEYAPAYLGLANCAFYAGDAEQAEGLLRAARDRDPTDPRAAILLSEILLLRGIEREGIAQHLEALRLIDDAACVPTTNHAMCYGDFGAGGTGFYAFWERSLLQREAFPDVEQLVVDGARVNGRTAGDLVVVMAAHSASAADVARRMAFVDRPDVVLVALDEIAARILKDHAPDIVCRELSYQLHELPAVVLHIGRALAAQGFHVVLPSDDAGADVMAWAASELKYKSFSVSKHGDVCASDPAFLDPRRVPPLLRRGQHPAPDTFAKVF
jgi:tetratricopeptide (TPR) repeat protein